MSLSCTVSEIQRHWSKIADCNQPDLYLAPLLGVTLLEFRRDLWCPKIRISAII